MKAEIRICQFCKNKFEVKDPRKIYCSQKCKDKGYKSINRDEINRKKLIYMKEYQKTHKPSINKYHREMNHRYRDEAFEILGNHCCICGLDVRKFTGHIHHKTTKAFELKRERGWKDNYYDIRKAIKQDTLRKDYQLYCPIHHDLHTHKHISDEEMKKNYLIKEK